VIDPVVDCAPLVGDDGEAGKEDAAGVGEDVPFADDPIFVTTEVVDASGGGGSSVGCGGGARSRLDGEQLHHGGGGGGRKLGGGAVGRTDGEGGTNWPFVCPAAGPESASALLTAMVAMRPQLLTHVLNG
jgi:hypothetical protein